MAEAARRAPELERPTWIFARRQTAARGRRGRRWLHPKGNFAATYVSRPGCTPSEAALRSFMAANALFETLALYVDRDALALKWPNDVLLNEGKIAGILLESSGSGRFIDWLAVGIGVNLIETPPDDGGDFRPVSLLGEGGERVVPDVFLDALATNYATEEALIAKMGFAPIRESWLRKAARLGEVITARTAHGEVTGTFETVDPNGGLVLGTPKGHEIIAAADVYF